MFWFSIDLAKHPEIFELNSVGVVTVQMVHSVKQLRVRTNEVQCQRCKLASMECTEFSANIFNNQLPTNVDAQKPIDYDSEDMFK